MSVLATPEPWDLVAGAIKHRLGPERWASLGPKIRERVGATLGDGPLTIGRGAFLGIGVA